MESNTIQYIIQSLINNQKDRNTSKQVEGAMRGILSSWGSFLKVFWKVGLVLLYQDSFVSLVTVNANRLSQEEAEKPHV